MAWSCIIVLLLLLTPTVLSLAPFLMPFPSYATVTTSFDEYQQQQNIINVHLRGKLYSFDEDLYELPLDTLSKATITTSGKMKLALKAAAHILEHPIHGGHHERVKLFQATNKIQHEDLFFEVIGGYDLKKWREFGDMKFSHTFPKQKSQILTDALGFFSQKLMIPINDNNIIDIAENNIFWLRAGFAVKGKFFFTEFPVQLMANRPNRIQVISDIDDTVLILRDTKGNHFKNLIKNSFLSPYTPVAHMKELYLHWNRHLAGGVSFHYVSGVLWPMTRAYVNDFFLENSFPWMSFQPRQTTLKRQLRKFFGKSGKVVRTFDHKISSISRMMDQPEWNRVIFVGDSTKYDYLVYLEMTRIYGFSKENGKVQCIFLRYVTRGRKKTIKNRVKFMKKVARAYRRLFVDWKSHVHVFEDGRELMNVDIQNGKCHTEESERQWNAIADLHKSKIL